MDKKDSRDPANQSAPFGHTGAKNTGHKHSTNLPATKSEESAKMSSTSGDEGFGSCVLLTAGVTAAVTASTTLSADTAVALLTGGTASATLPADRVAAVL